MYFNFSQYKLNYNESNCTGYILTRSIQHVGHYYPWSANLSANRVSYKVSSIKLFLFNSCKMGQKYNKSSGFQWIFCRIRCHEDMELTVLYNNWVVTPV